MEDRISNLLQFFQVARDAIWINQCTCSFSTVHEQYVFSDLLDVCIVVYLDKILIYSDNKDKHIEHIHEVLQQLQKHQLYTQPNKYLFHVNTIEYLGYILSPKGLTMDSSKVQSIQDWPEPRKVKDIQSFLGFANFYQQFIYNYSNIVIPLTHLMKKGVTWNFNQNCQSAFKSLKNAFTSAPILMH
jgi:hypothetical protein